MKKDINVLYKRYEFVNHFLENVDGGKVRGDTG